MSSIRIKKAWKDKLNKHEPEFYGDVIDTTPLQLESLCAFMCTLGYTPNIPDEVTNIKDFYGEYGFIYQPYVLRSIEPKFISLRGAVSLHNGSCSMKRFHGGWWVTKSNYYYAVWEKTLNLAYTSRLVETVYVQYSKKKKAWTTMKHRVQFTPDSSKVE